MNGYKIFCHAVELSELSFQIDWRGCVTADRVYLRDEGAWLTLDSFDHRSKGFNSLAIERGWDYYGQDDSSCNVFDSQDRHIGAAWVEAAEAWHPSGESYVLVYLGFRTDIPWVRTPENLGQVYAIRVKDYPGYFPAEIADSFAADLIDAARNEYERGLSVPEM